MTVLVDCHKTIYSVRLSEYRHVHRKCSSVPRVMSISKFRKPYRGHTRLRPDSVAPPQERFVGRWKRLIYDRLVAWLCTPASDVV